MPIVISRKTHEVVCAPVLTQEQTNRLWEKIVKNYLDIHPEVLAAVELAKIKIDLTEDEENGKERNG